MTNRSNIEKNRQLFMKRFPSGLPGPEDFEIREGEVPEPGEGEVLVRTHYLSIDAALRLIMRDSDEFLFRVQPGDLVRGSVAGEIVKSNNPAFAVGDKVTGSLGVQNLSVSDGDGLEKCDTSQAPLPAWLGGFGVSGLTAYHAIVDVCEVKPGQTVVINGAAGAVGSMAGQFARLLGAKTIGITSSAEKCRWLTEELGYDVAINYNDGDLYQQLVAAAPDRIDVIFDNVGGSILNESLRWIGMRGIVLLCGSTSQYTEEEIKGPGNYIWLGTMRARMQGFVVYDHAADFGRARADMAKWMAEGKLVLKDNIVDGDVADFPDVFRRLYQGENKGKMLIRLPAAAA